jgi:hypothetical protein
MAQADDSRPSQRAMHALRTKQNSCAVSIQNVRQFAGILIGARFADWIKKTFSSSARCIFDILVHFLADSWRSSRRAAATTFDARLRPQINCDMNVAVGPWKNNLVEREPLSPREHPIIRGWTLELRKRRKLWSAKRWRLLNGAETSSWSWRRFASFYLRTPARRSTVRALVAAAAPHHDRPAHAAGGASSWFWIAAAA